MRGLVLKDFILSRAQQKYFLVLILVFAMISYFTKSNFIIMIGMFGFILLLSTLSNDEYYKWDVYAIALPGGRRQIVTAKYLFGLLLIAVFMIIGLFVNMVLMFLGSPVTLDGSLSAIFGQFIANIFLMAVILPLYYKLGIEKSRMFIALAAVVMVSAIALIGNALENSAWFVSISLPDYALVLTILAISALVLGLSYRISQKIYGRKDF